MFKMIVVFLLTKFNVLFTFLSKWSTEKIYKLSEKSIPIKHTNNERSIYKSADTASDIEDFLKAQNEHRSDLIFKSSVQKLEKLRDRFSSGEYVGLFGRSKNLSDLEKYEISKYLKETRFVNTRNLSPNINIEYMEFLKYHKPSNEELEMLDKELNEIIVKEGFRSEDV